MFNPPSRDDIDGVSALIALSVLGADVVPAGTHRDDVELLFIGDADTPSVVIDLAGAIDAAMHVEAPARPVVREIWGYRSVPSRSEFAERLVAVCWRTARCRRRIAIDVRRDVCGTDGAHQNACGWRMYFRNGLARDFADRPGEARQVAGEGDAALPLLHDLARSFPDAAERHGAGRGADGVARVSRHRERRAEQRVG